MVAPSILRPPPIGADGGGGGGFILPTLGNVTPFSNSFINGASRTYVFSHSHNGDAALLCAAFKGSTDAGPPTYTIDEVVFNSTALTKIGESTASIFGTQPTVVAFFKEGIAAASGGFSISIAASAGDIQCIGMVGISLSNAAAIGSGLDSDASNTSTTSQSISITTGQDNSRAFGITAARAHANGGNITTPAGYAEHADFGTDFSSSTDIGMAVHSIGVASAGAQAYATSWPNSAAFGSLAFEIEGAAA